jgi:RNA polymerase sigma-70 factor (ECF subfamily)
MTLVCAAWMAAGAPVESRPAPVDRGALETREVATLVDEVQAGNRAAFALLYDRFHRVVHAVVLARVPACDAADIVQDVFTDAWVKLGSLREPAAFPGWLLAIARSRAVEHARRQPSIREALTTAGDRPPDSRVHPPPRAEAVAALQAIRELPETYRETLIMRLVEGLTGPEIAERTGMTPDSVRVHLHRGMMLLRERLGGPRRTP